MSKTTSESELFRLCIVAPKYTKDTFDNPYQQQSSDPIDIKARNKEKFITFRKVWSGLTKYIKS